MDHSFLCLGNLSWKPFVRVTKASVCDWALLLPAAAIHPPLLRRWSLWVSEDEAFQLFVSTRSTVAAAGAEEGMKIIIMMMLLSWAALREWMRRRNSIKDWSREPLSWILSLGIERETDDEALVSRGVTMRWWQWLPLLEIDIGVQMNGCGHFGNCIYAQQAADNWGLIEGLLNIRDRSGDDEGDWLCLTLLNEFISLSVTTHQSTGNYKRVECYL